MNSVLSELIEFGNRLAQLRDFVSGGRDVIVCHTYQSFSAALLHFISSVDGFTTRLQSRIKRQGLSCPLTLTIFVSSAVLLCEIRMVLYTTIACIVISDWQDGLSDRVVCWTGWSVTVPMTGILYLRDMCHSAKPKAGLHTVQTGSRCTTHCTDLSEGFHFEWEREWRVPVSRLLCAYLEVPLSPPRRQPLQQSTLRRKLLLLTCIVCTKAFLVTSHVTLSLE